ncbi:MAG: L,D-transpeptidase family protein [Methyloceanibacter sp.]
MLAFPASAEPSPSSTPPQAESTPDTGQSGPHAVTGEPDSAQTDPEAAAEQPDTDAASEQPESAQTDPNAAPGAPESAQTDPNAAPEPPKSSILINVDKSSQEMTVFVDGVELYTWPVSTGMRGYSTPSGTYTASSMNEIWYSKQWDNAPMPHAIFFTKKGHAIHGSLETKRLGSAASHGCVRLDPKNADTLFQLVKATGVENTQVVLSGTTKGGEGPKVASQGRDPEAYPPWFEPGDGYYPQPQKKRRGLFGKRWFQQYGPQGYYAPRGYYRPRGVSPRGY